ncbi:MAG: polysaccharide biosynthesis/export family protein [Bryobacteraceae bacterium]
MRLLILTAMVAAMTAMAQQPPAPVRANLPVQKLGPHDLIELSVYGAPELSRSIRVSADGKIRLPMLKQAITAQGTFPEQLEANVAKALGDEQLLVDPVVTVNILEYASRPISVAGAVKKPTTFQAVGATTLLDALTRAEGLGELAGPEILVTRKQKGPDGEAISLVQRIPVKGLIDAADPELNVALAGGEEIRVPEVSKIFVVGNVRKPGSYPVQDASDTTVLKMLALSEGLMPFANKQAFIYRRESASGAKNEIPIELKKIMDRKSPDVPLQPNDILYVPDNRGRRVGLTALEKIVSFGAATASGILIWKM